MPSVPSILASLAVLSLLGVDVQARPVPYYWKAQKRAAQILRREVPQEHSHNKILATVRTSLNADNPDEIEDPVFGLLGDAAAIGGAGKITDPECVQQATADQAFTNAKAVNDVAGMVAALQYRALERNTGAVGLKSNQCESITAVNPEIGAIKQHQDAASTGAAATNKAIVLELAKQIKSVGGDAQLALETGTFAPGKIGDPTGAGNTCDVANNAIGCIFTENKLVDDATAAEIDAAVAGTSASSAPAPAAAAGDSSSSSTAASSTSSDSSTGAADLVAAPAASSSGALDFGSCTNPTIEFGGSFDGRTEQSFEPENLADFNHGSADNIAVISSFICGQLSTSCKASAAAVSACDAGETAAAAATGGAAADAFNKALGFATDFAADPVTDGQALGADGATAGAAAAPAAAAAAAGSSSSSSGAAAPSNSTASSSSSGSAAASGQNVQTFTGTLGAAAPPVIETGGERPFTVNGDTFVGEAAALQRSCSIQNNACADAANAGASFSVSDCNAQETACNAAAAAAARARV